MLLIEKYNKNNYSENKKEFLKMEDVFLCDLTNTMLFEITNVLLFCEITDVLDNLIKLESKKSLRHYITAEYYYIIDNALNIRTPYASIGAILFDKDDIITEIKMAELDNTYPDDINEQMSKFIGTKIDNLEELIREVMKSDTNKENSIMKSKQIDIALHCTDTSCKHYTDGMLNSIKECKNLCEERIALAEYIKTHAKIVTWDDLIKTGNLLPDHCAPGEVLGIKSNEEISYHYTYLDDDGLPRWGCQWIIQEVNTSKSWTIERGCSMERIQYIKYSVVDETHNFYKSNF